MGTEGGCINISYNGQATHSLHTSLYDGYWWPMGKGVRVGEGGAGKGASYYGQTCIKHLFIIYACT